MPFSLNEITIAGNVGRDAEMRYTPNGTAVTGFSVACNYGTKQEDGTWKNESEWFNVVAWDKRAEYCAEIQKGDNVFVRGRGQTRTWEDGEGKKHSRFEVIADKVMIVSKKAGSE